jgi:hypothetical protein
MGQRGAVQERVVNTSLARRLSSIILATLVACVATIAASASPAHAFSFGRLSMKGSGALYGQSDFLILGVVPGGGARTWTYKVVNPGPTAQRFELALDTVSPELDASLHVGGKVVTSPYVTPLLAPGASQVVKLEMAIAQGVPQGTYWDRVTLSDPDIDWVFAVSDAVADATYQRGNTSHDLFMRTGAQPFVGGSQDQYQTSSAVRTGTSVAFTFRLQNDGPAPARISAHLSQAGYYCPQDFTLTVKQGLTDVTPRVRAGTYNVLLAPGAKKDLVLTVKETAAQPCNGEDFFAMTATGPDGQVVQRGHVLVSEA